MCSQVSLIYFQLDESAYQQFHSMETAVAVLHNDILRAFDSKQLSMLVLLDLRSAFDTVDHSILLNVLHEKFGVYDTVHNWFNAYLTERTQLFYTSSNTSDVFTLDCNVSQGSVVEPQQFSAYTEDIVVSIAHTPSDTTFMLMTSSYRLMYTRKDVKLACTSLNSVSML